MEELNSQNHMGESMTTENPSGDSSGPGPGRGVGDTPSSTGKITLMNGISAIFNGLGIGMLLGILLGLSISPVVSGVIATLSSLLAVLIGLNEKYLDPLKSIRIGAFGLSAVAGILLGLYLRANDPFAPTLLEKKKEYIAIGYSDDEARAFITGAIVADTGKTRREAHVLYSSTIDATVCDDLIYAYDDTPVPEILNTFKGVGGTWKELAETFHADLPEPAVGKALLAVRDCFCGMNESGKIKLTFTEKVKQISATNTISEIEHVLSSSDKNWNALVIKIKEKVPENYRKTVYLSILKVFSDE